MRKLSLFLTVAVTALLVCACAATKPPAGAHASLTETYWKLTLLDGAEVIKGKRQTEAHFVLRIDGNRVTGSGGCNRLTGSYKLEGGSLSFAGIASTKMACTTGMQQEQTYLNALGQAAGWRIDGQKLVLLDASGRAVANFESVYLK